MEDNNSPPGNDRAVELFEFPKSVSRSTREEVQMWTLKFSDTRPILNEHTSTQ
jgi:hypothetical protein